VLPGSLIYPLDEGTVRVIRARASMKELPRRHMMMGSKESMEDKINTNIVMMLHYTF
jgi:hypothetical protein